MAGGTVTLTTDTSDFSAALKLASEFADVSAEFRDGLVGLLEGGDELGCIDSDSTTTAATGELIVRLKPSDGLRSLLATMGARYA